MFCASDVAKGVLLSGKPAFGGAAPFFATSDDDKTERGFSYMRFTSLELAPWVALSSGLLPPCSPSSGQSTGRSVEAEPLAPQVHGMSTERPVDCLELGEQEAAA